MEIHLHPPMLPSRPCRFCLSLQRGSVFADFDVDAKGRVILLRISFDGFGCCTPARVGRMNPADSTALLALVERGASLAPAERLLRALFTKHREALWSDALTKHDLL